MVSSFSFPVYQTTDEKEDGVSTKMGPQVMFYLGVLFNLVFVKVNFTVGYF